MSKNKCYFLWDSSVENQITNLNASVLKPWTVIKDSGSYVIITFMLELVSLYQYTTDTLQTIMEFTDGPWA